MASRRLGPEGVAPGRAAAAAVVVVGGGGGGGERSDAGGRRWRRLRPGRADRGQVAGLLRRLARLVEPAAAARRRPRRRSASNGSGTGALLPAADHGGPAAAPGAAARGPGRLAQQNPRSVFTPFCFSSPFCRFPLRSLSFLFTSAIVSPSNATPRKPVNGNQKGWALLSDLFHHLLGSFLFY